MREEKPMSREELMAAILKVALGIDYDELKGND